MIRLERLRQANAPVPGCEHTEIVPVPYDLAIAERWAEARRAQTTLAMAHEGRLPNSTPPQQGHAACLQGTDKGCPLFLSTEKDAAWCGASCHERSEFG